MTVLELIEELQNYYSRYGDAEIAIVKTNEEKRFYDCGTIDKTIFYDDFLIHVDFGKRGDAK